MYPPNGFFTFLFILIVFKVKATALGLRIINLAVPQAVESGKNATLKCEHDVENDILYSLKWYRGRHEFFRYTPKELPAVKIFAQNGIDIDINMTNLTHLYLKGVSIRTSGKFTCEVSADAPSFHTDIRSLDMIVAVLPKGSPIITGLKRCYEVGDLVNVNCTCETSNPPPSLEWKINNLPVFQSDLISYDIVVDLETNLHTSIIGLNFIISAMLLQRKRIMIRCKARIYDLYLQETVEYLEVGKCSVDSPSLSYLSDDDYNLQHKGRIGSNNQRNKF